MSEKSVLAGDDEQCFWSSALEDVFEDPKKRIFMPASNADVFDVVGGKGILKRGLNDESLELALKSDAFRVHGPRMRFIFLDAVVDDYLPITSPLLRKIFEAYKINHRFSDYCKKQRAPGRALQYKENTDEVQRHEVWYSAVIRTEHRRAVDKQGDLSRRVLDWVRFCVWADYNADRESTFFIWRCPPYIKERFFSAFAADDAAKLQRHPMVAHVFFAEHVLLHNYDFLKYQFHHPTYVLVQSISCMSSILILYSEEEKVDRQQLSPSAYTDCTKAFLRLSRQVRQAAPDYHILKLMIERLIKENRWLRDSTLSPSRHSVHMVNASHLELQDEIDDNLAQFSEEVELIQNYNDVFVKRSKLGVNECFALVNQRDSELNMQMAAESTTIARASHQDNRSLRIIQVLSMVFLPASLVSGIFGMGFFTTQQDASNPVFIVSGKWWLYIAVTVPLTLAILILAAVYHSRDAGKAAEEIRRESQTSLSGLNGFKTD